MKTKINYKRDMLMNFVGAVVMFTFGGVNFSNGGITRGIILLALGGVMLGFGVYCLVMASKNKTNGDKK